MNESPKVAVFISFDYELFLGRNFVSHDEVLFKPTDELLQTLERAEVSATFFADVCSAWAHAAAGRADYVDRFERQLCDCVRRGHDVQLHIHPHWLRAAPDAGGNWTIDSEKMSLCDFGFGAGSDSAPAILRRGKEYLEGLLQPVKSNYRCCAFRAGGLVLQPNEGAAIAALQAADLAIDSSVAPRMAVRSELGDINYSDAPGRSTWRVAPESGLRQAAAAGILEMPIATFNMNLANRLRFLVRRVRAVGQSRGASITRGPRQTRWRAALGLIRANLRYLGGNPVFLLSCDTKGFDIEILMAGTAQWIAGRQNEDVVSVVMICHPKLMFGKQIALMETFIQRIRREYSAAVFATFSESPQIFGGVEAASAANVVPLCNSAPK